MYLGQKQWINKITLLPKKGAPYGKIDNSMSFEWNSIKLSKDKTKHALKVTKGNFSWMFVVPTMTKIDIKTGKTTEVSDPAILAKIKRFKTGDEVFVDYNTVNYQFVITDISSAKKPSKE